MFLYTCDPVLERDKHFTISKYPSLLLSISKKRKVYSYSTVYIDGYSHFIFSRHALALDAPRREKFMSRELKKYIYPETYTC